jgi:hypothetical protein
MRDSGSGMSDEGFVAVCLQPRIDRFALEREDLEPFDAQRELANPSSLIADPESRIAHSYPGSESRIDSRIR